MAFVCFSRHFDEFVKHERWIFIHFHRENISSAFIFVSWRTSRPFSHDRTSSVCNGQKCSWNVRVTRRETSTKPAAQHWDEASLGRRFFHFANELDDSSKWNISPLEIFLIGQPSIAGSEKWFLRSPSWRRSLWCCCRWKQVTQQRPPPRRQGQWPLHREREWPFPRQCSARWLWMNRT